VHLVVIFEGCALWGQRGKHCNYSGGGGFSTVSTPF
jgi:hypothetical protein